MKLEFKNSNLIKLYKFRISTIMKYEQISNLKKI
jgi:hypothetical protein